MASWPTLKWDVEPTGPLKGMKIVDMSTVVLGPFATLILADLGAEIIKIENSEGNTPGDMMRHAGDSPSSETGPIFTALNRNKKFMNLNVKEAQDKEILTSLLEDADVFFHNVRMAGMERLGFDYDTVKKINPDIIYVHCSGYGKGGPYSSLQAYDDLIQAASGFAALSELRDERADDDRDTRPNYAPSLVADKVSGMFAAQATMAAYIAKQNGAGGQFVQVPMLESFTWFNMVENLWGGTFIPGNDRLGYTRSVNPRRRPYPTKNGYIAIVPYNDKQWVRFFELGGIEGIFDDPRFSTYSERTKNIGELYAMIEDLSATRTTEEWIELLAENNIACMRYNKVSEVKDDAHLKAVGFFEERESEVMGKYNSMRHPVVYSRTPASIYADPNLLDADGDEIRSALGFN